jgi:integrase
VLTAGVEWGYLGKSPARSGAVAPPTNTHDPTKIKPFQSRAEIVAVADETMSDNDHALIRFACATGLRPEEWAALDWEHIDFDNHIIHVRQFWVDGKMHAEGKTANSVRDVALSGPARRALDGLARPLHGGAIFKSVEGQRIHLDNWRQRVWVPAITAAAKKLGQDHEAFYRPLYQMRHTYATLALAEGVTLEWVSEQMGHTDLRTTKKHYARFVKKTHDRMRALLDTLDQPEDTAETVTSR